MCWGQTQPHTVRTSDDPQPLSLGFVVFGWGCFPLGMISRLPWWLRRLCRYRSSVASVASWVLLLSCQACSCRETTPQSAHSQRQLSEGGSLPFCGPDFTPDLPCVSEACPS